MVKRLYLATESRLQRGPDGVLRSPHPGDWAVNYSPMLDHFDEVVVLARVAPVGHVSGGVVEGPGVSVGALPNYEGIRQAGTRLWSLAGAIRRIAADADGYFAGKLPGLVASLVQLHARACDRPFLANVVGDLGAVLASGTFGASAALLAPAAQLVLRRQVRAASAVVYVSERHLQQTYPASPTAAQLARSNVRLADSAFAGHRRVRAAAEPFRLVSIGSHEQLYKGHDVLLQALAELAGGGLDVELHLVGAGRRQSELRALARELAVADRVTFHGQLPPARVQQLLDACDLYVQPSRTEGLPRALVEAMARSLPCIGTDVGGIPELLDSEMIVPANDVGSLSRKIVAVARSAPLQSAQGQRNLVRAREIAARADPERYSAFLGQFAELGCGEPGTASRAPIRVAHILGSLDRGGVEMRTLQLISAASPSCVQTSVITLSGRLGALAEAYTAAGASIHPLRVYDLGFPVRFVRLLRDLRIDAVHSNVYYSSGPLLFLAWLAGVRTRIAHFRSDGRPWSELDIRHRLSYPVMRWFVRRFATCILGVSPSALPAALVEEHGRLQARVMPDAVDLQAIDPTRASDIRSTLVARPDEPVILHLGRADIPTKNRDGAIGYFAAHRRQGGFGTLVFAGRDGDSAETAAANQARWRSTAEELGIADHVVFLGERHDVADLLASADLLLFTSRLEGLPGVVLEACAMGTPVVASDVPGAVYLAEHLDGIRIVSLAADESVWVDAIRSSLVRPPTLETRRASHAHLRGSAFDVEMAARTVQEVWRGNH
jgi:glycosyltransferase involved in cell wall biosynthesis